MRSGAPIFQSFQICQGFLNIECLLDEQSIPPSALHVKSYLTRFNRLSVQAAIPNAQYQDDTALYLWDLCIT